MRKTRKNNTLIKIQEELIKNLEDKIRLLEEENSQQKLLDQLQEKAVSEDFNQEKPE